MNKDSHFTGQPVYSQVLKLLDKEKILQISCETKGSEAYVKRFDGYQHLVVMLFGILKHFDSLRELEIGMKAEAHKLRHLGLSYLVRRSTLAEANIRRPQEFFASVYPKSVIRISLCRTAKRNPLIFSIWIRMIVVFLVIWPNIGYACLLFSPSRLALIAIRTELSSEISSCWN